MTRCKIKVKTVEQICPQGEKKRSRGDEHKHEGLKRQKNTDRSGKMEALVFGCVGRRGCRNDLRSEHRVLSLKMPET